MSIFYTKNIHTNFEIMYGIQGNLKNTSEVKISNNFYSITRSEKEIGDKASPEYVPGKIH